MGRAPARPGYVAYRNTLRALHMQPVEIPCGPETGYQITAAAKTHAVFNRDAIVLCLKKKIKQLSPACRRVMSRPYHPDR